VHKSTHCALALLLGLDASGDDSDEKSPIQSSDAAGRDTGTVGASDTPNPAGEVSVRAVRYSEILIGRVWLREVSVSGCCPSHEQQGATASLVWPASPAYEEEDSD